MSNDYADPETIRQYEEAMANTPEALAAKAAADRAYEEYLEKVKAYNESLKNPKSGWFDTDSSPFGRGPRKGGSKRSRKSRRTRRR
jgi:hypothetical protein